MTVWELLQRAKVNDITVSLEGGKPRVRTPREPQGDVRALIEELREHKDEIKSFLNEEDPILTPEQWYPEFHRFHVQVVQETPNLDWQWLKEQRPDLYTAIRDKENDLDALGDARLSEVMEIMGEWRELILQAEMEATKTTGVVQGGPK